MVVLLDTSAWIEFFQGTEKGRHIENALKSEETFTSIVTLAEVTNWCLKNNIGSKIKEYLEGIQKGSLILALNETIATAAGGINYERKRLVKNWGMMDSFIVATASLYNLRVLTTDSQFAGLDMAEVL